MERRLYVDSENRHLAERRLRAFDPGESVVLICPAEDAALARALADGAGVNATVAPLDEERTGRPRDETLILPLVFYSVPLEHRVPMALPELQPHVALFRRLWRQGYRSFALYSLAGERTLRFDSMPEAFVGRHTGQRCFIVGNGPSLNDIDLTQLNDETTFGCNRGYLAFERMGGPCTYWGISDHYQIQQYSHEYEAAVPAEVTKFFPFEYLPLLDFDNACPVPVVWSRERAHQFSDSPDFVYSHFTVSIMLMQLAAMMGCDPIILVGVDHRYDLPPRSPFAVKRNHLRRYVSRALRGTRAHDVLRAARLERLKRQDPDAPGNTGEFWTQKDASTPTHFDARYTEGEEKRFIRPDPELMEGDYAAAADWAKANGRTILNATPGSALTAFPMVEFESLF